MRPRRSWTGDNGRSVSVGDRVMPVTSTTPVVSPNEGRDTMPGYLPPSGGRVPPATFAQRRPQRTPGRRDGATGFPRRRGDGPAQHGIVARGRPFGGAVFDRKRTEQRDDGIARSTKAGAYAPATGPLPRRVACSPPRPLNEGRSLSPGDCANGPRWPPPLNHGSPDPPRRGHNNADYPQILPVNSRNPAPISENRPGPLRRLRGKTLRSPDHRRFASRSDHPRLAQFAPPTPPQAQPRLPDLPGESVHDDRVLMFVDRVPDLPEHPLEPRRGQSTLEDGQLDPLPVLLADSSQSPKPDGAGALRVRDVVGQEDVHALREDERRIRREVSSKIAGEQCRLYRRQRPTPDSPVADPVLDLLLLVLLPQTQ